MNLTSNQNLDPQAVDLAKAIRTTESNNNYNAIGDQGTSKGAYQFHNDHFERWATQFGLDPKDFSPVNQDKVAYAKIKAWKDEGYHADEIAAMWNGAKMENGRPVAINPAYVEKVKKNFKSTQPTFNPAPFGTGQGQIDLSANQAPLIEPKSAGEMAVGAGNAAAGALGMKDFAQGLSTVGSQTPQKQLNQTAENTQNVGKLLQLFHNSKDPVQKQHLLNTIKAMGSDVSAGDINNGYNLKNSDVLKSAGATALTALAAGSYEPAALDAQAALETGKIADTALHSGQLANETPTLVNLAKTAANSKTAGLIGKLINLVEKGGITTAAFKYIFNK